MKKFLKQFYWVILGIFLLGVVFSAPALKQWNNSKFELSQYRMLFTDTGLPNGTPVMDINSWWSNISHWPLLDWELNPYITWYSETDPVFLINSGNYYPLAWNSISNPITWPLYMAKGSGAFNLEILTWQNVGLPMTADVPVLTPTAFLPGAGIFKVMLTKGRQFFMGEPGENTQMYLVNSTGDIGWKLDSNDDSARFKLQPFTGWAMNGLMWYTQWNVDWTIQAGNTGIITAINAWPAETYVTKGYVDWELSWIETFWEFDWVTLNPTATWDVSLKIGLGSQANTSNSASIGQYAWANWTGSYAFGNSAWALWESSFAIGWQANADGRNAYSVWYNSEANQEDSYVFGVQSVANWFGSMTLWQYATSNNTFSTAIWYSSQANADYSISAGNNTITNSVSSMAIWKYNVWNADSVFEVGFGTNTDRANLFEVKNNWNIYVSKLTGYTCLATDSAGMVYDNTGVFANYVPYTAVDTGFNNTGSDTIIPSEKAVWSLVSWLNNDYIPIWDGNKFINSSIFKTTDFLSLANITWAFLRIYDDFIFASTNIVDWKITQNIFKIWASDWLTTGVYIEWKMLDWVIDVYADTGVNLNTTDVVITGNIYADWSSVKFNTESFVWWFNSSVGGIKSASIWHNCQANGDFSIAIWSYSRAIWDGSISMWNQVKTYAHSSTALWRHTEARSAYWVVMGTYNVGNTDSLLEIWDGSPTTWYNEFEFKRDGRFIISEEWSFILNASGNLDVQYLSGSSWETAYTFTKS